MDWTNKLADRKAADDAKLRQWLVVDSRPMHFYNALDIIRSVLHVNPDIYVVKEDANTLNPARITTEMEAPRLQLDTGTWGRNICI